MDSFFDQLRNALDQREPVAKIECVNRIVAPTDEALASLVPLAVMPGHLEAGHPERPLLVAPGKVARRGLGSEHGRAALLHAVAHIEFNAINLALDAAWRFRGLPLDYYADWLSVARDESRHFSMLCERLVAFGVVYGDLDAHNGLWRMAVDTAHDLTTRMALVPRVLEARGLDVTPGMIKRLEGAGDRESAAVLRIIVDEERSHVRIGSRWFRHACELDGVEPDACFRELLERYASTIIRPPFDIEARLDSGFNAAELDHLQSMTNSR